MKDSFEEILGEIKRHSDYRESDGEFPSLSTLTRFPVRNLPIIVDEGLKLLSEEDSGELSKEDVDFIKEQFSSDIYQFLTESRIRVEGVTTLSFGQKIIASNALYHIAASRQYEKKYADVDFNMNKVEFEFYSIPFILRLAIESKLKSMIGFESCDVTFTERGEKKTNLGTRDFPTTKVLGFLIKNDFINTPCSFRDMKNIYSWSCRFTHDATKEYVWLRLKAIRMLKELFDFKFNKENYTVGKYSNALCYLKKGVTLEDLMTSINSDPKFNGYHKLTLSKSGFDEAFGYYNKKKSECC